MLNHRLQAHARCQQILDLGARPAPLFPVTHAHAPSDPLVQFRDRAVVLADAEVRCPTPKVLPQFSQPVLHGYTPASTRQLFDPVLEVGQGLVGPAYLLALDREAQESAFAHGCQLASTPSALYAVSVRRLAHLLSGFLQTGPRGPALAVG